MSEVTSGVPSDAGQGGYPAALICAECGHECKALSRKMCGTCYMRAWRGGGIAKREPLDPEIAALLLPVPGTSASFAERVFTYVDATGDCWEWGGANQKGYGTLGRGARGAGNMQAHRAVWELLVGPLSDDLQIDHLCRNHACCNPDHLDPVPAEINKERGFSPAVLYSRRDTCDSGHPLDGVLGGRGGKATHRYCKTCARARSAAANALKPPKPPRTHCNSGKHPWTEENIYTDPKRGKASCKACKNERQQAAREAVKRAA